MIRKFRTGHIVLDKGWMTATAALTALLLASACGSSTPPKHHAAAHSAAPSSKASTGNSDSEVTPSQTVATSPLAKHLLQQADLPTGAQIKPITGTALGLLAQQVAGAASPERSSSNKPACAAAMNSGAATKAMNPDQLAGQAIALAPNSVLTEILGPKSTFAKGITAGKRQAQACAGATINQTVNGVRASTKPTFRTGPDGSLIEDAIVTATGKTAVHNTQAIVADGAGSYGVAFSAQSTGPISSAAINKYITRAVARAGH